MQITIILNIITFILIIILFLKINNSNKELKEKINNDISKISIISSPIESSPNDNSNLLSKIDTLEQKFNNIEIPDVRNMGVSSSSVTNEIKNSVTGGYSELGFEVSKNGDDLTFNKNIIFNNNLKLPVWDYMVSIFFIGTNEWDKIINLEDAGWRLCNGNTYDIGGIKITTPKMNDSRLILAEQFTRPSSKSQADQFSRNTSSSINMKIIDNKHDGCSGTGKNFRCYGTLWENYKLEHKHLPNLNHMHVIGEQTIDLPKTSPLHGHGTTKKGKESGTAANNAVNTVRELTIPEHETESNNPGGNSATLPVPQYVKVTYWMYHHKFVKK